MGQIVADQLSHQNYLSQIQIFYMGTFVVFLFCFVFGYTRDWAQRLMHELGALPLAYSPSPK